MTMMVSIGQVTSNYNNNNIYFLLHFLCNASMNQSNESKRVRQSDGTQ